MTNAAGDWSTFGGDPTPGDAQAVGAVASVFSTIADTGRNALSTLRGIGGQTGPAVWSGKSADAFDQHLA
ncbi:MAG: hypothetical protein M3137_06210, partial [Actinomycetota bacterium]|nr:hypothetical protein [Actinomycetota bacterium]